MKCYICESKEIFSIGTEILLVSENIPDSHYFKMEQLGFRFDLCKGHYDELVKEIQTFVSDKMRKK